MSCLVCSVKPKWRCINCDTKYCDECRNDQTRRQLCPSRPLYGSGKDGHYIVGNLNRRPILQMPPPIVVNISKKK